MIDPAGAAGMLDLAAAYLRNELHPDLEGRHRFFTLVAANVLDILSREIRLRPAAELRETERLKRLLGRSGDRQALNHALRDALAEGGLDESSPGLLEHLFATTMDNLAIDQPRYAAYRRELAKSLPPACVPAAGTESGSALPHRTAQ